jgi:meiotic recombination protein REC8
MLTSVTSRLVGTLGPSSTALKVKRKQILGVDVKKACETIIQPEAPMALRLQSSLLLVYLSAHV